MVGIPPPPARAVPLDPARSGHRSDAAPGSARQTDQHRPDDDRDSPDTHPTTDTHQPPTEAHLATRTVYHGTGALSFSTKGEYGVRLMVQLAARAGRGPASLAEIALEEDLPRAYLEQLVMSLRDAGLVRSTRGARGGYELTRDPAVIRMGEVLRALEGPIAPMICASEDAEHAVVCDRSSRCTVNVLWVRIRDAVTGALDSMTLADLVPVAQPRPGPVSPEPTATTLTGVLTPS